MPKWNPLGRLVTEQKAAPPCQLKLPLLPRAAPVSLPLCASSQAPTTGTAARPRECTGSWSRARSAWKKQRCRVFPPVPPCFRLAVLVSQPCGRQEREHVKPRLQPSVGQPTAACSVLGVVLPPLLPHCPAWSSSASCSRLAADPDPQPQALVLRESGP